MPQLRAIGCCLAFGEGRFTSVARKNGDQRSEDLKETLL